jgi:hypothetical protein
LKKWTIPDFRNTTSTTNLEDEEIVDAPGNDGNASMPEQVKRPNPWRKMTMIRMMMMMVVVVVVVMIMKLTELCANAVYEYVLVLAEDGYK